MAVSEFIYLYDKLPDDFGENGLTLIDWMSVPEINRQVNGTYQFYGVYQHSGQNYDQIEEEKYISAIVPDGSRQFFEILEKKKTIFGVTIAALHMGYGANRNFIDYSFTSLGTGKNIMNNLHKNLAFNQLFEYDSDITTSHQFTAKEVKPIEAIMGSNNGNQNLVGVSSGELDMNNNKLYLKKRIGADNGHRVDFGINMESIEEIVDKKAVINSLYLIGGIPEDTNYDDEQSPVTYKYLNIDGLQEKDRRIGSRTNDSCKTEEELKKWGISLFEKNRIHEARVTHIVSMIDLENTIEYQNQNNANDLDEEGFLSSYDRIAKLQLGDTVYCSSPEIGIDVQERMIEYTWFPTITKYKEVVLGNEIPKYTNAVETSLQQANVKLEEKTNVLQNAIINATNWLTGTTEGHVVFRPKNAPKEILIMDTPDVKTAKKVWRWNMGGLGYSSTGVDGEYGLAMTQDGAIVADYITAGVLRGIKILGVLIQGSTVEAGDEDSEFLMRMANGRLEFFDNTKENEIMLGSLSSTKGATNNINGIALRQVPGYILSLNTQFKNSTRSAPVFQIPADSDAENRKWRLIGNGTVTGGKIEFEEDVEFKGKVTINGEQVYPGQGGTGGGSWNGEYPPEVTTDVEKRAWEVWMTGISQGHTKQSIAGEMGNIDVEAPGFTPTASEGGNTPGYGYGLVQWTDSTGQLSGRDYMLRLMAQAGITENPDSIQAQMKLIDWHAKNGQWIPTSGYPYSWDGFKKVTNVEEATYAFLKNFERAGVEHVQRRIDAANYWYNKFKDLKQPGGKYGHPVTAGTPVTSWFGWRGNAMHNGIDFGGAIGDPIFAAQSGTVVFSYYDNDMGEWVVIKHDNDEYMTGYAHNSARLVNVGDKVTKGQQIARMGSTGDSTGPHLHFAVQTAQWSGYVDPAPFLGLTPP